MTSPPRQLGSAPTSTGRRARRGLRSFFRGSGAPSSAHARRRSEARGLAARIPTAAGALVAALSLLVLAAAPASASHEVVDFLGSPSGTGTLGGQFNQPREIAVNRTGAGPADQGDFYVADDVNHRLQRFDSDGSFVSAWGADVDATTAAGTAFEICTVAAECKTGVASGGNGLVTGNGTLANPQSVAVDGDTGNVYVSDRNNRRINVYDGEGNFLRSFGFGVIDGGSGGFEICVHADGDVCKAGFAGAGVGQFGTGTAANTYGIAVSQPDGNPATGTVFLANTNNRRVETYDLDGQDPANFGTTAEFAAGFPRRIAVDSRGIVYASNGAQLARYDSEDANGGGVGFLAQIPTPGPTARAVSGLAVDSDDNLYVLREPSSGPSFVAQFGPTNDPGLTAPPAEADAEHGSDAGFGVVLGLGLDDQSDRLYVTATTAIGGLTAAHRVFILGEADPVVAELDPVTTFGANSATFTGEVNPGGAPTRYRFEYVTAAQHAASGFDDAVRLPTADVRIGNATSPVSVQQAATGLKANTTYHVRLVANRIFSPAGETTAPRIFTTTTAPPAITEQLPLDVGHNEATLRARINPNGLPTTYYFELGTDTSYGTRIPANHDLFVGSGPDPVAVSASPAGLTDDTVYFFRVVAANSDGTTVGPDQAFSTLNQDGLAWSRRYELVSPPDKGPAGQAGQQIQGFGPLVELPYQTSPDGESIAYPITWGLSDATSGGEVAYRSDRTSGGWLTAQVTPSLVDGPPPGQGFPDGQNWQGRFNHWLSRDLDCAFAVSFPLLTDDPEAQPVHDAGGYNLYRRNPDGSYDLVSNRVPTNPGADHGLLLPDVYLIAGAAEDCERVVFEARYLYPDVPLTQGGGGGAYRLYEWHDGTISNPAAIPGPSGPEFPNQAVAGAASNSQRHAVSEDGSRLYFTTSGAGTTNPLGRQGIFLRELGEPTVEVSASQTSTPNTGDARYQMATPDGEHAFFIARYGLAPNDSSTGVATCTLGNGNDLGIGCDLYRYTASTGELLDVSASSNPEDVAGASVAGVLDASDDGSRVYFAAKGQLVAGKGQAFTENDAPATRGYNVYLWDEGAVSHVGTVSQNDVTSAVGGAGVLVSGATAGNSAAQATPDGSHLIFNSSTGMTGPSGVIEAYRYSAATDEVECVSCRRDGEPSLGSVGTPLLGGGGATGTNFAHPMPKISADGSTVFFQKQDPLAPGTLDGQNNLYEWREGQITHLVSNIPGGDGHSASWFWGASDDGETVFFRTRHSLVPHDTDGSLDIYAARVGGGFPPPPPPPPICDLLGGGCQGAPGDPPPAPESGSQTQPTPPAAEPEARDCSELHQQARQARQRARSQRQRVKRLRQRANRQARRGNAEQAQRLKQRASRIQRRMRSNRQRAQRLRNRAQQCREAQGQVPSPQQARGAR